MPDLITKSEGSLAQLRGKVHVSHSNSWRSFFVAIIPGPSLSKNIILRLNLLLSSLALLSRVVKLFSDVGLMPKYPALRITAVSFKELFINNISPVIGKASHPSNI